MEAAADVDMIVLLSGDGDFDLLLKKVKDKFSVNTQVYGVEKLTAQSLINATDVYHQINSSLLM
jgi:uncharacterized LabA/DUF88 family protein